MNKGDIVKCKAKWLPVRMGDTEPKLGVVVCVDGDSIGVEFHNVSRGHDCGGNCANKKGWFVPEDALEVMERMEEVEFPF